MGYDKAFDPEAALKTRFEAERMEEARGARPLAGPRARARKPSRSFADALSMAALAACLAIGAALPFRSPLIDQSRRAFAACARNGTFRTLGDRVSAMSRRAGDRLSAPRDDLTTEEP